MAETRIEVAEKAISENLAFRMAIALANPKAYEQNRDELARILAEAVVAALSQQGEGK